MERVDVSLQRKPKGGVTSTPLPPSTAQWGYEFAGTSEGYAFVLKALVNALVFMVKCSLCSEQVVLKMGKTASFVSLFPLRL